MTAPRFFLALIVALGVAAAARAADVPAGKTYADDLFDQSGRIAVGKITKINESVKPVSVELKFERNLFNPGGNGVTITVVLPAGDGAATYKVGDEGIWLLDKQWPQHLRKMLPKSEVEDVVGALGSWLERQIASKTALLAAEAKVPAPFAKPDIQEAVGELVNLLQQERFLTQPMTFDLCAKQLTAIYKALGIELGFPLNPKTDAEVAAATKIALAHPMYRDHPPEPKSPMYENIVKDLSMMACLWCEQQLRHALTASDAGLQKMQEQMRATTESAQAKLDTRIDVLAEIMRLTREGKLPNK